MEVLWDSEYFYPDFKNRPDRLKKKCVKGSQWLLGPFKRAMHKTVSKGAVEIPKSWRCQEHASSAEQNHRQQMRYHMRKTMKDATSNTIVVELLKLSEAHHSLPCIGNMELQYLTFALRSFGFTLVDFTLSPYSSLLEQEYLSCVTACWKYLRFWILQGFIAKSLRFWRNLDLLFSAILELLRFWQHLKMD